MLPVTLPWLPYVRPLSSIWDLSGNMSFTDASYEMPKL